MGLKGQVLSHCTTSPLWPGCPVLATAPGRSCSCSMRGGDTGVMLHSPLLTREALPPSRAGKYHDWGQNTQLGRLLLRMCSLGRARGLPTARWPEGTKELVILNKPCPSDASSVQEPGPDTPLLPLCSEPVPTLSNGLQCDRLGTMVPRALTFASGFMFPVLPAGWGARHGRV